MGGVAHGGDQGWILALLGGFLLAGYAAHVVGRRAHVPRVTLLLLLGWLAGPGGFDLVEPAVASWFPLVAKVALSLVGFILGERFFGRRMADLGRLVITVSVVQSVVTALVVFTALLAIGTSVPVALLFGGIATATAPAATVDVIREVRARGPVTDVTTGVVALDDAYAVILFSLLLVLAQGVTGHEAAWSVLFEGGWEVLGGALLGVALGVPMAWLTGRARPGELTLLEALGFVLLTGGLASLFDVSYLLACMTLGAVVARRARHHTRPLHAIEGISQPFLVLFFLLAGFEFDPATLGRATIVAAAYVASRTLGKVAGGYFGARLARAPATVRRHVGWCLLPQAGVALGLALLAEESLPEVGRDLLSILVGTTFAFEVLGPISTRLALDRAREARTTESQLG